MDAAEIVKNAATYGADYINLVIVTLTRPREIQTLALVSQPQLPVILGYAAASVLIGTGFQRIVLPPGTTDRVVPDYVKAAFVLAGWVLYASVAHLLILSLGDKAERQPFLTTLIVTVSITSSLYVACSFAHVLANLHRMPVSYVFPDGYAALPAVAYWLLHLPLVAALTIIALCHIHGISGIHAVAFGVLNTVVLIPFEIMGLLIYRWSFGIAFS